jgi:hypothetical protein
MPREPEVEHQRPLHRADVLAVLRVNKNTADLDHVSGDSDGALVGRGEEVELRRGEGVKHLLKRGLPLWRVEHQIAEVGDTLLEVGAEIRDAGVATGADRRQYLLFRVCTHPSSQQRGRGACAACTYFARRMPCRP